MMTWDFFFRLLVAGVLGALVGIDREYRAKEAGFRTHFLVALGSALFMIVSKYGFEDILGKEGVGLDPSRIASQVVTGIGFLGAGTIIIQKLFVRGLTTAAGIWTTAAVGLAVGAGQYWLGISATLLTLLGLEGLGYMFRNFSQRNVNLTFTVSGVEALQSLDSLFFYGNRGVRGEEKFAGGVGRAYAEIGGRGVADTIHPNPPRGRD